MLCAVLAISLIVIAILIASMKKDDTQYCKGNSSYSHFPRKQHYILISAFIVLVIFHNLGVVPLRKNTGMQETQQVKQ